jgi:Tfp pilus assembly protein PilV
MRRKLRIRHKTQDTRLKTQDSRPRGHRSAAGFTITEVVVASALLIIAIVPLLKALTSAQVTSSIIERRTRSLTLAQAKLDDIKARSIYSYSSDFTESNTAVDGLYLCNVADTAVTSDLRQVTVSVGYDLDGDSVLDSDEVEVTLTTLLAKRWL